MSASSNWSPSKTGYAARNSIRSSQPSDVELNETVTRICYEVESHNAARIVFDSLSEMRLLAREPLRYRRQVLALKQFFAGRRCTVLLLDDRTSEQTDLQLQSISHGVITLQRMAAEYGGARRRLQVTKLRGLNFQEGYHDFKIVSGGVVVFPRLVAAHAGDSNLVVGAREVASSGIRELDEVLGGGLHYGTSTLILGPAGCGKSTLITQYARALAMSGKRVNCYVFEETRSNFLERALGLGMDLRELLASGRLGIEQIDPAEMSPGEFAHKIRIEVERDLQAVIIDSLNGYLNAMPSESFLLVQMHELLTYLNQRGVLTLMVLAQQGIVGTAMQAPVDLTYLSDAVIALRYFEAGGEVRQVLAVIKKRTGPHERSIREFRLESDGIHLGRPLSDFQGVLTGVPVFRGESSELLRGQKK